MDKNKFLERYAYFYDALQKLGKNSLLKTPTIEDLKIPKSKVQTAYRDIKDLNFKNGVVDYLCYISSLYINLEWQKGINSNQMIIPSLMPDSIHNNLKRIEPSGKSGALGVALFNLYGILLANKEDGRNTIRLFFRNPKYFYKSDYYLGYKELFYNAHGKKDAILADILCFQQISKVFLNAYQFDFLYGLYGDKYNRVPAVLFNTLAHEIEDIMDMATHSNSKSENNQRKS